MHADASPPAKCRTPGRERPCERPQLQRATSRARGLRRASPTVLLSCATCGAEPSDPGRPVRRAMFANLLQYQADQDRRKPFDVY